MVKPRLGLFCFRMIRNKQFSKLTQIETPFYCYDLSLLRETLNEVKTLSVKYEFLVHYAIKANYKDRILGIIRDANLGADCVSGNEVLKSIEIGFKPSEIVFAGVGKSDKEIDIALNANISGFNCESLQELLIINELAGKCKKKANVSLRINPNVDAKTHKNITTGLEENKFGINVWELSDVLEKLDSLHNLSLIGLHFHIGSQVTDLTRYKELCTKVNEINRLFIDKGLTLNHINVGGGLGINYMDPPNYLIPDFKSYFEVFNKNLQLQSEQQVHFELGRAIVGQCGLLVTKVLYEKIGKARRFLILDAGMTELMRPALYQAHHHIENISSKVSEKFEYDVVGPICETTDAFARGFTLPKSSRGDHLILYSAGAYGEVLKNRYNLRDEVGAIYSDDIME